jgi:hypothetical protein
MAHKIVLSGVSEEMNEGICKLADGKKEVANALIKEAIQKYLIKPETESVPKIKPMERVKRKFSLDE